MWKKAEIEFKLNTNRPSYILVEPSDVKEVEVSKVSQMAQLATVYPKLVKKIILSKQEIKKYQQKLQDYDSNISTVKKDIDILEKEKSNYLKKITDLEIALEESKKNVVIVQNSPNNQILSTNDTDSINTEGNSVSNINTGNFSEELQALLGAGLEFITEPKVYVETKEQLLDDKGLPGDIYERS